MTRFTWRHAPVQVWGKIRRAWLIAFARKTVEKKLEQRRGACHQCGICCKLLFRCPAYDDADGNPKCLIYNDRPGVCGLFPLDAKDLRDRNLVSPGMKCGYWFEDASKPLPEPIRWGPPPAAKGVKATGTFAIIRSFFGKPGA